METGLKCQEASHVKPPLLEICPVNIECVVAHKLRLPSHSLFVANVVAVHADTAVLDKRGEVDFNLARGGLPYREGTVRERPINNFKPKNLLKQVNHWRDAITNEKRGESWQ
jgi:flavin reductase (DIM6/NTAB) family NADH-FMN oxidoreductase RutF